MIKGLISFIIIEYHSIEEVITCVNSLQINCIDLNYEIVVSSNSMYCKEKQESIAKRYPDIKWCFNKRNGGFAYGMNRGILMSSGEFIVLQNPDTEILNHGIKDAIQLFEEELNIGLIGPKILNEREEVQDSCRPFLTPRGIISRLIQRKLNKKDAILEESFDYNQIQSVNWVIGAFMITTRQAVDKVGLLNEQYFMYVEDMEWCLNFWENGFKVVYFPSLLIKYQGDRKSTQQNKRNILMSFNKYTYIHIKNYLKFLNKNGINKIKELQKIS